MWGTPMNIYDIMIISLGFIAFLSYSALLWSIGRRKEAIYHMYDAFTILFFIVITQLIILFTIKFANFIGVKITSLPDRQSLIDASHTIERIRLYSVNWILTIAGLRAALLLTPFTYPLSYVLGSATNWSMTIFNLSAIVFLFYSTFAQVFAEIYPYMIFLGTTLTPIPKLRSLGSGLLSAAITLSIAILYIGYRSKIYQASLPLPPSFNPVEWLNIAALASDAAIMLTRLLVESGIVFSVATTITIALSRILSGVALVVKTTL